MWNVTRIYLKQSVFGLATSVQFMAVKQVLKRYDILTNNGVLFLLEIMSWVDSYKMVEVVEV